MTPLAHRIVKELTLPLKRRTLTDQAGLLAHLRQEFHTFEVTAVVDLAVSLSFEMLRGGLPSIEWTFLPAERTWVEWNEGYGTLGVLLRRSGDFADVIVSSGKQFGAVVLGKIALHEQLLRVADDDSATILQMPKPATFSPEEAQAIMWRLYAFLLIINSPRVVGRTLHDPHRGLARKLVGKARVQGVFPLQAWTEIVLRPETIDESDEPDVVTGLTGQVCRHWVRAHKQRYHGIWTLVGDYWRGDASLGIKQSRYKLVDA